MTISLSDIQPVYSWMIKVIVPFGAIAMSPLSVVWFLYELNSSPFSNKLPGISHRISVQSIMALVVGYFSLNTSRDF